MTDLNNGILGIDISKAKFDVALMVAGKVKKTHIFENAPDGYQTLSNWLLKQGITKVAACMEATGCYGENQVGQLRICFSQNQRSMARCSFPINIARR